MIRKLAPSPKSTKVYIAPYEFDNWAALLALLRRSFAYMEGRINPPSSLDSMLPSDLTKMANVQRLIIAEHSDQLVGCGFLALRQQSVYLGKIAVATAFRRQGLLRHIVCLADEMAREHGKPMLELQARIELSENRRTFEALGFFVTGETSHTGFERPTSITMQRRVPAIDINRALRRDHNGGPPLKDPKDHVPPWGKHGIRTYFAWKRAYQAAWRVSPSIAKRRVALAQACGLTYEEYTSVLLDTGRHLQPSDTDLIAKTIARR